MFPWNKTLPLLYCTLETFILSLQESSLWADMRDFLIICPINAGRLGVRGCFTSGLRLGNRGTLVFQSSFWGGLQLTCSHLKKVSGVKNTEICLRNPALTLKKGPWAFFFFFFWTCRLGVRRVASIYHVSQRHVSFVYFRADH